MGYNTPLLLWRYKWETFHEHVFLMLVYIYSYNQSNKAETLEQNRTRKEQIERKIEKIDTEQKDVVENIDKLRKDLSTQKVSFRGEKKKKLARM